MKRKLIFTAAFAAFFIACVFISGILAQALPDYAQWLKAGTHGMYSISIDFSTDKIIGASLTKSGMIILTGLFIFAGYMYYRYRTRILRDGRNFNISCEGTYGTAGWMSLKEAKQVLEIESIHNNSGIIFGHISGEVISLPHNTYNNKHVAVYGASGSMKSRAFVRNNIMQLAMCGKSIVLTDPKGELFSDTADFLKKLGYTVRLFNLVHPELSDRWNCLAEIIGMFKSWQAVYLHRRCRKLEGSNSGRFPRGVFPYVTCSSEVHGNTLSVRLYQSPEILTQFKASFPNASLEDFETKKVYYLPAGAIKAVEAWLRSVKEMDS